MMPQELLKIATETIPRRVSFKIWLEFLSELIYDRARYTYYTFLILALLFAIFIAHMHIPLIIHELPPLSIVSGNRITTQGAIVSITPHRLLGEIGPSYYYGLIIRFHDGEQLRHTHNFVWRRRNIPGWAVIPEIQSNRNFTEVLRLDAPFPVTVEYISSSPHWAQAAGTRPILIIRIINFIFWFVFACSLFIGFMFAHPDIRRIRCLLKKGVFTTGYIRRKTSSSDSLWSEIKNFFDLHSYRDHIVRFKDQSGMEREGIILVSRMISKQRYRISALAFDGNPVGLLYLPDMNEVIVTDLLRDKAQVNFDFHFVPNDTGSPTLHRNGSKPDCYVEYVRHLSRQG